MNFGCLHRVVIGHELVHLCLRLVRVEAMVDAESENAFGHGGCETQKVLEEVEVRMNPV